MASLKLGKNTLSDLAKWFNISVSAFRHNKEKYLKILEDYAVFELRGNKNKSVYITEILNPYYDKGQAYDLIKKLTEKNWDYEHLDTCTHVAKKNYPEIIEAGFDIKETTNVNYTRRSKTEMFGKAGDNIGGSLGFCEYQWGKLVNDVYYPLTEEERKVFSDAAKLVFKNPEEKLLFLLDVAKKDPKRAQELAQQEVLLYDNFIDAVRLALGFTPIRCTKVTKRD